MRRLLLASSTLMLVLAGCSGDADEDSSQVATLVSDDDGVGDAADAATRTDAETAEDLTPDEAALEFSQCMRDEGLDFPDLAVDAEGNINLRAAFQSVDPQQEGFRDAAESCRAVLEQAGFGGGARQAIESPEVQDALLEFSACVRDAGYDVGDLTLGAPGARPQGGDGSGQAAQDPDADGEATAQGGGGQAGQRQGGFGNRGARFADQLGLDYDDPAVQDTIDGCLSIIEEAFASATGTPPGS